MPASPTVTVSDVSNVFVDGVNAGQAMDVITNNPDLASAVQLALVDYFAQLQTAHAAQVATLQAQIAALES